MLKVRVFKEFFHFLPSLIFVGSAISLSLYLSPIKGSTRVGPEDCLQILAHPIRITKNCCWDNTYGERHRLGDKASFIKWKIEIKFNGRKILQLIVRKMTEKQILNYKKDLRLCN